MAFTLIQVSQSLGLESGDALLLETGDSLRLELSIAADYGVIVEDGSEAVQLYTQDPYIWFAYEHPSVFFEYAPGTLFEVGWLAAIGQREPDALMPVYDPRSISGDVGNMPDFWLTFFLPGHFGPDGDGDVSGPTFADILEGPARVDVRTQD